MAFQLIPFYDEPTILDVLEWEPRVQRRSHCPALQEYSPLGRLDRLTRQLARLQDHVNSGLGSEVSLRDNAFNVNLNVDGFKPEGLKVSVKDNMLTVTGKHEDKSEDGSRYVSREFTRSYRLPETAQVDQMKSTLAADGRTLKIETPVLRPEPVAAPPEQPKAIPIEIHRGPAVEAAKQG